MTILQLEISFKTRIEAMGFLDNIVKTQGAKRHYGKTIIIGEISINAPEASRGIRSDVKQVV